jgi:hypothetical protein
MRKEFEIGRYRKGGILVCEIVAGSPREVAWLRGESMTSGRGSAWLERLVRDQEVGGSNPLAPTNSFNNLQGLDD